MVKWIKRSENKEWSARKEKQDSPLWKATATNAIVITVPNEQGVVITYLLAYLQHIPCLQFIYSAHY